MMYTRDGVGGNVVCVRGTLTSIEIEGAMVTTPCHLLKSILDA